jgi:hypothetical protein
MFGSLNIFQMVVLMLILVCVVMIFIRQNNTCVMKQNKVKEGFLNGDELGMLNDWARDIGPRTNLNNTCKKWDDEGKNLNPGQFCKANCAPLLGKGRWQGGENIVLQSDGSFKIQNNVYQPNELPTKEEYCMMSGYSNVPDTRVGISIPTKRLENVPDTRVGISIPTKRLENVPDTRVGISIPTKRLDNVPDTRVRKSIPTKRLEGTAF